MAAVSLVTNMKNIAIRNFVLGILLCNLGFSAAGSSPAASVLAPTNLPSFLGPAFPPAFVDAEAEPPFFLPVSPNAPGFIPIVSPSPMIPVLPNPITPKLSGLCPMNLSSLTPTMDRTAQDCLAPLATFVGEVICCPQLRTLYYMAQGRHINSTGRLALNSNEAKHCSSDINNLLVSKGANNTISRICSLQSGNLTRGKCPATQTTQLEKLVNTTRLLAACKIVDPLKECCRPVCQPALQEAAYQLTSNSSFFGSVKPSGGLVPTSIDEDALEDCKKVLLSWVTSQIDDTESNTALRNLFSCKINQACPLVFSDASSVIEACRGIRPSNITCCQSLHKYISQVQQQKLITNLQALECVSVLGSLLQNKGVTSNIYGLCGIYLKDFSLQGSGDQGCLLNSLPSDVILTNTSQITFTCDLNDNIAAPWISMSSSLCLGSRSNVSFPKIPQSAAPLTNGAFLGAERGVSFFLVLFILVLSLK